MTIKRHVVKVYDMTCTSCEKRVEKEIKKINGVQNVMASLSSSQAVVEFDTELCTESDIKTAIHNAGYSTENKNGIKLGGILLIAAAIVLLGNNTAGINMEDKLNGASYFVLFLVGMLTSIHCVGMCGGIALSQGISIQSKSKLQSILPSLKYNLGRIVSYTIIGGIVGALGSVLSLSITVKAIMQMAAGLFMIIMGFNMAGFSLFKKINLKLPSAFCAGKSRNKAPFIVGLLNGLMPCGPLQTMQLYALGTGSAFKGALSMFLFASGTVPLMLVFGALSGLLSKGYTKKLLKYSGILVIVLGIIMGNRGLALAGIKLPSARSITAAESSGSSENAGKAEIVDGVQVIRTTADNRGYTPYVQYVEKNKPVKWIIEGKALNSCNNSIVVPSLNKQVKLKSGENVVEFTAGDKDINYSCWMGMITGVIKVTDSLGSIDQSEIDETAPPAPSGGAGCCGGGAGAGADQTQSKPSIYGDDIKKISTDRIIKRSTISGNSQSISLKGIGYEFEPLVVVINKSIKTSVTLDLSEYDYYDGNFSVLKDGDEKEFMTFQGKKGIVNVNIEPLQNGTYWVIKDSNLAFAIEVVDNNSTTDLESIRGKYFGQ